ncbi:MAG: ABC transporter substrate-binding protein [Chloroflexi bacterium]|nr:ABC transporter substrate-binding protein [Chloroflexota bacterium]
MRYLLGIDDTDNLESRGTGHRVRQFADWLAKNDFAEPLGITRHQLLVDSRIPYTSHNSSACLSIQTENANAVWEAVREFLLRESAVGSDAGLCLAEWNSINVEVLGFGRMAKLEVLTMPAAMQTASRSKIRCEGLTGTHGGIIGALSAIGLHRAGNDGRYLWLPGLRDLEGKYQAREICMKGHIDRICTVEHKDLSAETMVDVGEWVRPILRDGKSTLYVEEKNNEWYIISKDRIKSLSN